LDDLRDVLGLLWAEAILCGAGGISEYAVGISKLIFATAFSFRRRRRLLDPSAAVLLARPRASQG
jgi:hypothetical protein